MKVVQRLALVLLALPILGCKPVYEGQYDDRADELEASRSEFKNVIDRVQFFTAAGGQKIYWVNLDKPLDDTLLHSTDAKTGVEQTYEFTRKDSNIQSNYKMSDDLVVKCGSSTTLAFDANMPTAPMTMTDQGSQDCTVDGRDVYFIKFNANEEKIIRKWTPATGAIVDLANLKTDGVGPDDVGGFGVIGNRMLLEEGGRLWLVNLTSPPIGSAEWLENDPVTSGVVDFDNVGVIYPTSTGNNYTLYAGHATFSFQAAVNDGGYSLNFEFPDVHKVDDDSQAFFIYGKYIIYRAQSGIFAYGLETKKVVDLLLDRGTGFDTNPLYRNPTVTSNGTLFVDGLNQSTSNEHTIYRVELSDRLK